MAGLNEKTLVPLWSVLAALPALVIAFLWISSVAFTTNANANDIKELKIFKESMAGKITKIRVDVAVIRSKLDPNYKFDEQKEE